MRNVTTLVWRSYACLISGFRLAFAVGGADCFPDEVDIPMSSASLDRLLSAASEVAASDLHLVTGIPPAFRVNGEIIIADEDALTQAEVEEISKGLLNEQQK